VDDRKRTQPVNVIRRGDKRARRSRSIGEEAKGGGKKTLSAGAESLLKKKGSQQTLNYLRKRGGSENKEITFFTDRPSVVLRIMLKGGNRKDRFGQR